ncbi:disks large-associated protein 5 isoform X3 [Cynoglossus semilaevis]|uniref:disks large-associated protein 5 isoform X3 n=1 Tax=Cynoglossus semilaevis TaxID=244447 RepID=UPI0004980ED4|nr:disks large-associated protein 5 isoform X3 [Cynoglossus semilaevis]
MDQMESKFSHLRRRDTSVSMLRVKMSRRKSQTLKENRDRAVNSRRQLDKLPELEASSLDASIAMANMSTIVEKTQSNAKSVKDSALEERIKRLEEWKKNKALVKEKEKREKERKGIFKTGMYHPKDTFTFGPQPVVPVPTKRTKEIKVDIAVSQSTRVTRDVKQQQQQQQQPLKTQDPNTAMKKAQPAVERLTWTRAAPVKAAPATALNRTKVSAVVPSGQALQSKSAIRPPVTVATAVKDKPKDKPADVRITRSRANNNAVAPSSGRGKNSRAPVSKVVMELELEKPSENPNLPSSEEENMIVDPDPADLAPDQNPVEATVPVCLPSFAPKDFVFQAPDGLLSFRFEPMTPRTTDAFLTPTSSFNLPPAPVFSDEPQSESSQSLPPKSPLHSPPQTSIVALPTPGSPTEPKHDVPYFRSEISSETERLTALCVHWECKVEDESIPEEMRDGIRTAIGQARLLMKERFKQFTGLVDDCDLGRGEKITTCTDLQGFWDMVHFQVEDVGKKFDALKEAEAGGWVEERRPPPRQRKVVKKPAAAPAKATGTKAGAKSRLAAAKAAMKARQQAAEEEMAAKNAGYCQDDSVANCQELQSRAEQPTSESGVSDEGCFQVESPVKAPGLVRRSTRLSGAVLPQASSSTNSVTPRRVTRRSLALVQTPVQTNVCSPAHSSLTPAAMRLTLDKATKSQNSTPRSTQKRKCATDTSLCFSPVKEVMSGDVHPVEVAAQQSETDGTQETNTAGPFYMLPSFSVEEVEEKAAEMVEDVPPVSPRSSLSPCKTPPSPVSQVPEPLSSLSFSLSPSESFSQPPITSATIVQSQTEAPDSVSVTPDTSVVEEMPGLDWDRYLRPSQRCSLSPRDTVPIETLSPMAVDVEMESPRGRPDDLLTREPGPNSRVCSAAFHPRAEGQDTSVGLSQ